MSKNIYLFLYIIIYNYCQESFEDIVLWYKELKENANPDIKLILVGNKSDLKDQRKVDNKDVKNLINDLDIDLNIECSAKSGENVEKLFVEASKMLYKQYLMLTNMKKESTKKLSIEKNNKDNKEIQNKKGNECTC